MEAFGPLFRLLFISSGGYLGYLLGAILSNRYPGFQDTNAWYLGFALALTFFLLVDRFEGWVRQIFLSIQQWFSRLEPRKVTAFTIGIIAALLVSVLLNNILQRTIFDNLFIKVFTTLGLGGFFTFFAVQNSQFFGFIVQPNQTLHPPPVPNPKILDTNVIIDGRIADLAASGFLEGTLVVPLFVLRELQFIADHGDTTKRTRGRRGLEVLETLKGIHELKVIDWDTTSVSSVDDKLIRLTRELKGKLVSNDYNLSKVAKLQEIEVLNLNELAVAIKAKFATGDVLTITISKEGQQTGQGVGYLEDGTMVVVENALVHKGKPIRVMVMSNIQTAVGRMIFAKLEDEP
ncbi:MAG: PIN/TRAM domain-containing protein [Deinococcaceae bacterium]